jgi:hypothetical protein
VGLALLAAMAAGVALLGSSEERQAASPTSSSTLPGYPADPASTRPVVPWLATPAPAVRPPPAPVPVCHANQLRVENIGGEGATGHAAAAVRIENATPEPCSIDDRVMVELRDRRGRLFASSTGQRPPFICSGCGANRTPGPLLVPPLSARPPVQDYGEDSGKPGVPAFWMAQGECPGGVFPEEATLFLATPDGRVPIANGLPLPFDYRCDNSADQYPPPGRPKLLVGYAVGIPVMDFADNDKVTVEISAPPKVRAGSLLRYRIRTRVSGDVSLAILGCPAYTQHLVGVTEERHLLNCNALERAPEYQILWDQWFDMVLRVPRYAKPGRRTLTWELDPPFGRARASLEIEIR